MATAEQLAALTAENPNLKDDAAAFAEREGRIAAAEQAQRHDANVAFCEQLVKDARLHPSQKDNAVSFLDGLPSEQTIEFSEGDAKAPKPMADAFKVFLQAQPKIVEFAEVGKGKGEALDTEDPTAIASKAVEFVEAERKQGREISIAAAVQHVSAQVAAASN
jgi:predicted amino acid dehydrogenase